MILSSVPKEQAGAASAVSETAYELGAALGIALLGSIVTGVYRGFTAPAGTAGAAAHESLGGRWRRRRACPPRRPRRLLERGQEAFVNGLRLAAGVGRGGPAGDGGGGVVPAAGGQKLEEGLWDSRPARGRVGLCDPRLRRVARDQATTHPRTEPRTAQAAFAFVAYMSTYSWPDSRMTSAITESVTARSTYRSRSMPS